MMPAAFSNDIVLLAHDARRGWCIFAFGDEQAQLDFGPMACMLPVAELPELAELVGQCHDMPARSRNARRGRDVGTVCYAAEHRVFALIVGNAVMRFAPAEFAAMSELLHSALDAMAQLLDE